MQSFRTGPCAHAHYTHTHVIMPLTQEINRRYEENLGQTFPQPARLCKTNSYGNQPLVMSLVPLPHEWTHPQPGVFPSSKHVNVAAHCKNMGPSYIFLGGAQKQIFFLFNIYQSALDSVDWTNMTTENAQGGVEEKIFQRDRFFSNSSSKRSQ